MKKDIIQQIATIIKNENYSEKEALFHLKQILFENEIQNIVAKDSKSLSELVADSIGKLKKLGEQGHEIKSGFRDFDSTFGGFMPGELVVIGGRPGMGKTQLLVNLALNISVSSPVLYFTFDLSAFLLTSRIISFLSGVPINKILQQDLTEEQKDQLESVQKQINQHAIFINDTHNTSMLALKAHCEKMIKENGIKVIIVDYLQMMGSPKSRNSREQEISFISRELKNLAKEFNLCIIVASQLSRAVESRGGSKHPYLSDLRESGSIEQDADKVIFIYRPEYYAIDCDDEGNSSAGIAELIVAKNRNGNLGEIKIQREANFTGFRDFEQFKNSFTFSKNRLDEIDPPF